jgi:hypothetical protein
MKNVFAMFLTLCVSAALVGCGEAKKDEKPKTTPPAATKPAEEKK